MFDLQAETAQGGREKVGPPPPVAARLGAESVRWNPAQPVHSATRALQIRPITRSCCNLCLTVALAGWCCLGGEASWGRDWRCTQSAFLYVGAYQSHCWWLQ